MSYRCKICQSNQPYFKKRFGLYHCPTCSVYFLDPRQWPKDLGSFYERAYRGEDPLTRLAYFDYQPDLVQLKASYCESILAEVQDLRPGPLLDVGCGQGIFLEIASRAGFRVSGLEPSRIAAQSAPRRTRTKIKVGNIDTFPLPKNSFKVVTLINVFEHLFNPLLALRKINTTLRPGGMVYLTTPNINSFWVKLFGRYWWGFKPDHIFFFNPQSLKEILRRAGFSKIEVSPESFYYSPSQLWQAINCLLLNSPPKILPGLKLSRPRIPLRGSAMKAQAFKPK